MSTKMSINYSNVNKNLLTKKKKRDIGGYQTIYMIISQIY